MSEEWLARIRFVCATKPCVPALMSVDADCLPRLRLELQVAAALPAWLGRRG